MGPEDQIELCRFSEITRRSLYLHTIKNQYQFFVYIQYKILSSLRETSISNTFRCAEYLAKHKEE